MPTPLAAFTLPAELDDAAEHRRLIVEAVRQLAQQLPQTADLAMAETQVTATSWTTIKTWTIGSQLHERLLEIRAYLKVKADDLGSPEIHPLEVRVLLDSVGLDGDWRLAFPETRLLVPVPTPLTEFQLVFSAALQTIGRGSHTLELQAQTSSGGAWTFSSTSRLRYTMR